MLGTRKPVTAEQKGAGTAPPQHTVADFATPRQAHSATVNIAGSAGVGSRLGLRSISVGTNDVVKVRSAPV